MALVKETGLENAVVVEKSWKDEEGAWVVSYKFWKDKEGIPSVWCSVFKNGKRVEKAIDDNCEVYEAVSRLCTKEDGNNFYRWLMKPGRGFKRVK